MLPMAADACVKPKYALVKNFRPLDTQRTTLTDLHRGQHVLSLRCQENKIACLLFCDLRAHLRQLSE